MILEPGTKQVDNSLIEVNHPEQGWREVQRGGVTVATDDPYIWARAAKFAMLVLRSDKSIAWIGGGLCVGPKLLHTLTDVEQTIYEIEGALAWYAPEGARVVPGDWKETISGTFDAIIYDVPEPPDWKRLRFHLKLGGSIICLDYEEV